MERDDLYVDLQLVFGKFSSQFAEHYFQFSEVPQEGKKKTHDPISIKYVENDSEENKDELEITSSKCKQIKVELFRQEKFEKEPSLVGVTHVDISKCCKKFFHEFKVTITEESTSACGNLKNHIHFKIRLHHFGARPEEVFPFYSLFSPRYQFAPLLMNVLSYLPGAFLIRNVSLLSHHCKKIVRKLKLRRISIKKMEMTCKNVVSLLSEYELESLKVNRLQNDDLYEFMRLPIDMETLKELEIGNEKGYIKVRDVFSLMNYLPCLEKFVVSVGIVKSPPISLQELKGEVKVNAKASEINRPLQLDFHNRLKVFICKGQIEKIFQHIFWEFIFTHCISLVFVVCRGFNTRSFSPRTIEFFMKHKPEIRKQSVAIPISFAKDFQVEEVYWNGHIFGVKYYAKKFENVDSLFVFSLNPHRIVQITVGVEATLPLNKNVKVERKMRKFFLKYLHGVYFHRFCLHDITKKDLKIKMNFNIKHSFTASQYDAFKAKEKMKALRGKKIDSLDLVISLRKFDHFFDGTRKYTKIIMLNGLQWEVYLTYNVTTGLYDIFYANINTELVVVADVKLSINMISRGFHDTLFRDGRRTGWTHLKISDHEKVNLSIICELKKMYTVQEYKDLQKEKVEETEKIVTDENQLLSILNLKKTVKLELKVPSYTNSQTRLFSLHGLPWKFIFNKKWGKYGKPSFYLQSEFSGEYIMFVKYQVRIEDTSFKVDSSEIAYYSNRGWGFDELVFPDDLHISKDHGKKKKESDLYKFVMDLTITRVLSKAKYFADVYAKIVKNMKKGMSQTVEIRLNSANVLNPIQTNPYTINGVDFLVEFFPLGMDDNENISVFLYHQLFNTKILSKYTLSTVLDDGKTVKRTIEEGDYSIKFPSFCKINIKKNWVFTLQVTVVEVIDRTRI